MKVLITGMSGAVAPVVARRLWQDGHTVIAWDRERVPIDDERVCHDFVRDVGPDWFFHFATGAPEWAETVARISAELDVPFLFTSSVSVFSDRRAGPFDVDATPDATDDYGRYKIECERRVREANPDARVARLGWQIGDEPGANHMVDHLHRTVEREGRVEASRRWIPACSFLDDTAEALHALMIGHPPGLYHLDGNPGLSFYEIVRGLDRLHDRGWKIVASDAPELDNRMVDPRVSVAPITARLSEENSQG